MPSDLLELLNVLTRKDQVWAKGYLIAGYSPAVWRRDSMGSAIRYADYGDRDSEYGWEIDHIDCNGPDELWNLQPLQWRNNARKSDQSPPALSLLLGGTKR
jgi:hypothetical protein